MGLIQVGSSRTAFPGWAPLLRFYEQRIHKSELSGQLFRPELSAWTISIPHPVDFIASGQGWQGGRSIRETRAGLGALPAKRGLAAGPGHASSRCPLAATSLPAPGLITGLFNLLQRFAVLASLCSSLRALFGNRSSKSQLSAIWAKIFSQRELCASWKALKLPTLPTFQSKTIKIRSGGNPRLMKTLGSRIYGRSGCLQLRAEAEDTNPHHLKCAGNSLQSASVARRQ